MSNLSAATATPAILFQSGQLSEAIALAGHAVREAPTDLAARIQLAELLLFEGNFDRADKILDTAAEIDPTAAIVVAEFRQLIRAELARRQVWNDGRPPELLDGASETIREMLIALVAVREHDFATAAIHAGNAETVRPHPRGENGGTSFADLRDASDLNAGFFEILTTTGKAFWIPTERMISLEFHPPRRIRDLYWRRATVTVNAGPDGEVYLPVLYDTPETPSIACALGRATEWQELASGLVRGIGQRAYLIDDALVPIMTMTNLSFVTA